MRHRYSASLGRKGGAPVGEARVPAAAAAHGAIVRACPPASDARLAHRVPGGPDLRRGSRFLREKSVTALNVTASEDASLSTPIPLRLWETMLLIRKAEEAVAELVESG